MDTYYSLLSCFLFACMGGFAVCVSCVGLLRTRFLCHEIPPPSCCPFPSIFSPLRTRQIFPTLFVVVICFLSSVLFSVHFHFYYYP